MPRFEIADALDLTDEMETFRRLYNAIRPHDAIDFDTPLSRVSRRTRRITTYFGAEASKNLDAGHSGFVSGQESFASELTQRRSTGS